MTFIVLVGLIIYTWHRQCSIKPTLTMRHFAVKKAKQCSIKHTKTMKVKVYDILQINKTLSNAQENPLKL